MNALADYAFGKTGSHCSLQVRHLKLVVNFKFHKDFQSIVGLSFGT